MRLLLCLLLAGLCAATVAHDAPQPCPLWSDLKPRNVFRKPLAVWSEVMNEVEKCNWSWNSIISGTGGTGGTGSGGGECGKTSSTTRIAGGERAKIENYPWMAALTLISSTKDPTTCGGSLISSRWVLTAAHCTKDATIALVNLGSTLASNPNQSLVSETLITHKSYNAKKITNDIALIKLPSDVSFSNKIRPVCLPRQSVHGGNSFAGVNGQVSGWGRYSDSSQSGSEFLRHVTVPIIDNSDCKCDEILSLPATQMCVDTTGGKSSCIGDSGGPLQVKQSDGTYLQVGIVSYGSSSGCEKGVPAVFTRVTKYLTWISNKTGINLS